MFVIRVEHRVSNEELPASMWLFSVAPVRYTEFGKALQFASKGAAQRAVASIKLAGDWFIEPV